METAGVTTRPLEVIDLGRMDYEAAFRIQEEKVEARRLDQIPDTLLLVEHDPVFTLGRNADPSNVIAAGDIPVVPTTRGGDVTYHGPGQLVAYPIINLAEDGKKAGWYVSRLEQTIMTTLATFGIETQTDPDNRGVWVGHDKIAAIGVRITRGITLHGIALNVDMDLSVYSRIVPCGIQDRGITTMNLQGATTDLATVQQRFITAFCDVFGYTPSASPHPVDPVNTSPSPSSPPPRPLREDVSTPSNGSQSRKPSWLKTRLGQGPRFARTQEIVRSGSLHTVCEEALCPNRGQCWENGRATIMILGQTCSRACTFCNVEHAPSPPSPSSSSCQNIPHPPPDPDEPQRVANAIQEMDLSEVVITSVTRDDLTDGGAAIWAETVARVRDAVPCISVEVLVPDFQGAPADIDTVLAAAPDVFAHNLETVPSLYPAVRPQANYQRSLAVLKRAADANFITKTGIMVGLGETKEQVLEVMRDARAAGATIFTIGQYLQPSKQHHPVVRHVEPAEFDVYRNEGLTMGFGVVASAPLVRSSLHSEEQQAYVTERERLRVRD